MPLDPQAASLIETLKAAGRKPMETLTPADARVAAEGFKALAGTPEPVQSIDHRFIPGPTADLPIRVYTPDGAGDAPMPALVYLHGGGWVIINIDIVDPFCRSLANRTGCKVVTVNYQKAPEHKFPVPFNDCYAATQWVSEHAEDLGITPNRLGIMGDSAGGNLAAAVTLRARDDSGPSLAYQVLIYPAVRYGWDTPSAVRNAEGYLLQRATMQYYWTHYVNHPSDGEHPYCSPLLARDHSGLPPALIVSAEFDPLCDDGRDYAHTLEAAGVRVTFSFYEGMIHGFLWMSGVLDQSKTLLEEIGQEVKNALHA